MGKTERKDFWEKVSDLSDWFWGKFEDCLNRLDSERFEKIGALCLALFWPVLILWILAALARFILLFI